MTLPPLDAAPELLPQDVTALKNFDQWCREAFGEDPEVTTSSINAVVNALQVNFTIAREKGVDPHDPQAIEALLVALDDSVEEVAGEDDDADELLDVMYQVLRQYAEFRIETDDDPEAWEDAQELIEENFAPEDTPLLDLLGQLTVEDTITAAERRAALVALPVVAATPKLLSWIGRGRPASPSGGARRSDIRSVAALIGVVAVGVNRQPSYSLSDEELAAELNLKLDDLQSDPGPLAVLSMNEVPELAAWWFALTSTKVIEPAKSRLRPGPQAAAWLASDESPTESMEEVAAIFLASLIADEVVSSRSDFFAGLGVVNAQMVATRLLAAAAPEAVEPLPGSPTDFLFATGVDHQLARIARQGFITVEDETILVPEALRLTVVRAVILAGGMLGTIPGILDDPPQA